MWQGTRGVGLRGEQTARDYLVAKGYSIVDANYFCRAGEIDLVAYSPTAGRSIYGHPRPVIAFVEVKYRRTLLDGGGVAAVGPVKLRRMRKAATHWLTQGIFDQAGDVRFDVIDVGPDGVREHLEGVA